MKNFTPRFPWFPHADMYIPRKFIQQHVINSLPCLTGRLLDVGCGYMPYKKMIQAHNPATEYLGMDLQQTDIYHEMKPDILWDGYNIPLKDQEVDNILITEVLEHCPYPAKVLSEVMRVLKPGGKVVFTVPFIWYLHESPWDFYRYTPYAIRTLFKDAGLNVQQLETYGNGDLAMLHFYLVWIKRGGMPKLVRFIIYLLSLPFILLFLLLANKKNSSDIKDGKIFAGIVGIAEK